MIRFLLINPVVWPAKMQLVPPRQNNFLACDSARGYRLQSAGNRRAANLGQIERIPAICFRFILGHNLDAETPPGIVATLDVFEKISLG